MCGIIAYCGKPEHLMQDLMGGLKRLEYRGYDSAGVAVIAGDGVYVKKTPGKIAKLEEAVGAKPPSHLGRVGIAHTRWATHGAATKENAHPHRSADGNIWLVHNGIIENYSTIKQELQAKGIKFESETDTEVAAKLIGDLYDGDLLKAVLRATDRLHGAFAMCVMAGSEPGRLIGVKQFSPLVVGLDKDAILIASDASAVIPETKNVIYLKDGELVDVQNGTYTIHDFKGAVRTELVAKINWDAQAATKQGFDHYLLKEIMEQPTAVRETIRGRIIRDAGEVMLGGLTDIQDRLASINHIVLLGVGTSNYAAKLGELYFNALTGVPTSAVMSPEYRYTDNPIDEHTWLIAVSQSGETADTIAAIEKAKHHGALVTGIVNVVGSSIARMTDAGAYNHIGPEISVASTKAFTSQAVLLLLHALYFGQVRGSTSALAPQLLLALERLPEGIGRLLEEYGSIAEVAAGLKSYHNLLYIGRRYNYPVALEGALKIKEIAYVHAEGLSGGELKHGFIALIDKTMPTIALATRDSVTDKMLDNIQEVKARGGRVIGIASAPNDLFDDTITVPDVGPELLQPLVNNVALQLLAYYSAKLRGHNIDQPRNLAKSVTVE